MQLYPEDDADVIELTRVRCLALPCWFLCNTLFLISFISTRDIAIPEVLKRRMVQRHGVQVVVEAIAVVAAYNMVSRFLVPQSHSTLNPY